MPKAKVHGVGLLDTWGRRNRKFADRPCDVCGKMYRPRRAGSRFCSYPCMWSQNGGRNRKDAPVWWVNNRGYVEGRVWLPDGTQRRVKQHRYLLEAALGRPLLATEDVHHRDGNKSNNALENLEIVPHGAHSTRTNKTRPYPKGYKCKARALLAKIEG
jgi:hypothetical protein